MTLESRTERNIDGWVHTNYAWQGQSLEHSNSAAQYV